MSDGDELDIDVPRDGGLFEGHFPGHPILPGVAQISLIVQALRQAGRSSIRLAAVPSMRMRQLVYPGDSLHLSMRVSDAHHRFDLTRAGRLVSRGEFAFADDPGAEPVATRCPAPLAALEPPLMEGAAALDVAALLPHHPPIRLVTAIAGVTAQGIDCAAAVPATSALTAAGIAPSHLMVEVAAQAAAAWESARRSQVLMHDGAATGSTAGARIGYLVALRDVAFNAAAVPCDRTLQVRVRLIEMALPLTRYQAEVDVDGAPLMRGQIATMLTDQTLPRAS